MKRDKSSKSFGFPYCTVPFCRLVQSPSGDPCTSQLQDLRCPQGLVDRGWSENFYIGNFNNFPNSKSMPGARPVCLPLHLTAGSQERSILKTSCKNNLALQRKLGTCLLCAHDAGGCNSKHTAAGSAPDLSLSYKFYTISALHQTHQLTAVIMIISPLRRNVEERGLTLT